MFERESHATDLVRLASTFAESLSPEEVGALGTMLEENGGEIVEAAAELGDSVRQGTVHLHAAVADQLIRCGGGEVDGRHRTAGAGSSGASDRSSESAEG